MKLPCFILLCIAFAAASPIAEFMQFEKRDLDCSTALYREKMLAGFNVHRANHSVDDMVWNQTLADAAKNTTENGPIGVHDNGGTGWGQNLYEAAWSDDTNPVLSDGAAIDSWYNGEFRNYDTYGNASILDLEDHPDDWSPPPATPDAVYGHFTQCIWKDSITVGCHTANRTFGDYAGIYTACNFYPPGNWVTDDFAWYDNVLEPLGDDVVGSIC